MATPVIETCDGKVLGTIEKNLDGDDFYAFRGIPYGKPPIGNKRFKAPEPIDRWEGVKDCTKDGEKSFQIEQFISLDIQGSEDCLHLNVFAKKLPNKTSKLKPVMVFLFGGRFRQGSNRQDAFGPKFLLLEDIILVLPNCRVGLLGFLSLEDESLEVPGNAALKDQNLALRWVQKNIRRFGGDPNNVTLAGHSSGSMAVHYHLLSPLSVGLFQKAILMSGTAFWTWTETDKFSLESLADVLNIKQATEKELLNYLQNIPAKEVVEAQEKYFTVNKGDSLLIGPVVEKPNETAFITEDPTEMILNGKFNNVPVLMTYASDEGLMYDIFQKYLLLTGGVLFDTSLETSNCIPLPIKAKMDDFSIKQICAEMDNIYSYDNFAEKRRTMLSDFHFIAQLIAAAKTHAELSEEPVYLLRWSMNDELNFLKVLCDCIDEPGTAHADELGYILDRSGLPKPKKGSSAEKLLRKAVHLVTNFCRYGNPSLCQNPTVSRWLPLQNDAAGVLDFGNDIKLLPHCPEQKRMEIWQKILDFDKRSCKLSVLKVS